MTPKKRSWFLATQSVGIRRLSLAAGLISALYKFFNPSPYQTYWDGWIDFAFMILGCLFYFLCAWVPIRLVAWITSGFLSDFRKSSN